MRRIAVINQKGGVGKTTTAVNMGAALAARGHRVLFIDLDPQSHLSLHVGLDPAADGDGIYEALAQSTPLAKARKQVSDNLWAVGASIDLAAAEIELAGVVGREVILRDLLAEDESQYDYVIMDCPPSLGLLTLNALCAANEVFIPLQPHYLALHGLSRLLETVSLVAKRINAELKVTGVVICMHEPGTRLATEVLDDVQSFLKAAEGSRVPWAGARVFNTAIRRNVKLAECPSHGQTIFQYAPDSNGAKDYLSLAEEVQGMFKPAESVPAVASQPVVAVAPSAATEPEKAPAPASAKPKAPAKVPPKPPVKAKAQPATPVAAKSVEAPAKPAKPSKPSPAPNQSVVKVDAKAAAASAKPAAQPAVHKPEAATKTKPPVKTETKAVASAKKAVEAVSAGNAPSTVTPVAAKAPAKARPATPPATKLPVVIKPAAAAPKPSVVRKPPDAAVPAEVQSKPEIKTAKPRPAAVAKTPSVPAGPPAVSVAAVEPVRIEVKPAVAEVAGIELPEHNNGAKRPAKKLRPSQGVPTAVHGGPGQGIADHDMPQGV